MHTLFSSQKIVYRSPCPRRTTRSSLADARRRPLAIRAGSQVQCSCPRMRTCRSSYSRNPFLSHSV